MQSLWIFGYQHFCFSWCSVVFVDPQKRLPFSSWQSLLIWQLHTCRQSAGCREGHAVPCRAEEDQLIVLEAVGTELSPTSYLSLLNVCTEEFVNFTHNSLWRTVFLPGRTEIWISMWFFLELAVLQTYYKMVFDMKLSSFSWRKWLTQCHRARVKAGDLLRAGIHRACYCGVPH